MAKDAREITIDDLKGMDLDKLRHEIQEMEGDLEIETRRRKSEIDGRKQLLKVVDVLINGKPQKKWTRKPKDQSPAQRQAAPAGETGSAKRGRPSTGDKIEQLIMARGPMVKSEIVKNSGMSDDSVSFALNNDERFIMDSAGRWLLRD